MKRELYRVPRGAAMRPWSRQGVHLSCCANFR